MAIRILLAATGCAQAEVVPDLVERLLSPRREEKIEVIVAATEPALQFFDASEVERSTGRPVFVTHAGGTGEFPVPHVDLAEWARAVIVYPASANTIAKCAHGICDSLVSTVVLAARCPVYFGPMMNESMWEHPITQANVRRLAEVGYRMVPREEAMVRVRSSGRRVRTLCCTPESVLSICEELRREVVGERPDDGAAVVREVL